MIITPKDWGEFQHYKERAPPWIKLHKKLLVNYDFCRLPVASRALAPMLWLLASEYDGGIIKASLGELAFRLHLTEAEVAEALNPLIEADFFAVDSAVLAPSAHDACLETEAETQEQTEEDTGAEAPTAREKKSRKKPSVTISEDWKPDAGEAAYAKAQGLTDKETDREAERFRNNARQNDRRCADWPAAWRNWVLKSAEFLGRAPPSEAPVDAAPNWDAALASYQKFGTWKVQFLGPEPGSAGCAVPIETLQKYGLAPPTSEAA